ncbi:hypothetical protein [Streptomyces sp. NPDC014734]|uniref:hypothetical protein n=1 Tax=Streptomyces sp. NPDC014734 TaxID=3364886 RepID=UPI0036F7AB30
MSNTFRFDITAGDGPAGRITFRLSDDIVPRSAECFRTGRLVKISVRGSRSLGRVAPWPARWPG